MNKGSGRKISNQGIWVSKMGMEKITIKNIPEIRDVSKIIELLGSLGVKIKKESGSETSFQSDNINPEYLTTKEFRDQSMSLRGSIMIVGPLLARFGKTLIPKPSEDRIGRRRLATHLIGFQKLGANIRRI